MAIKIARETLGRVFGQRCFYLFIVLLAMIGAVPFIEPTTFGRTLTNLANLFVIVATVAAVGRTTLSFVIALLLAAPVFGFQWIHLSTGDPEALAKSWGFGAALYAGAIAYLLTSDKLFGAAAAYLMIGVFWAYVFAIVGHVYPGAFAVFGSAAPLSFYDGLYFSFTVLTSTGFGDITPLIRQVRGLCVIEQVLGALFLAVLIARLAGVYPPAERETG